MDLQVKKQALRLFTYGLYAVSCLDEGKVNAFTANWLSQVSFEPSLLAISVENASMSLPMILHSKRFAVNVLRSGQRDLAGKLGKSALKNPGKLEGISYALQEEHFPVLHDALAWVGCELRQSLPAGDSTLLLAEVVAAGILAEGQPLTMLETGFRHAG
ncbi:flavin reductase [Ktedonosporobacter rubrisoli]|uniref:Flavin reductase n=1 Tax=Ktedonosporobacter rubrisoli TaxID=2509675 RepID=A0A4P6JIJ1_KTERU|nr:flavin reductase family protein [Ktedonosporobacter rubrisoli]QBD74720.1 flavin reductase [Ktedonosporobacter rubrisoli]